jgi:hypothetical protein
MAGPVVMTYTHAQGTDAGSRRRALGISSPSDAVEKLMNRDFLLQYMQDMRNEGKMKALDIKEQGHRSLQSTTQNISFVNCVFDGNVLSNVTVPGLTVDGVITLLSADNVLMVRNSIFSNNVFDGSTGGVSDCTQYGRNSEASRDSRGFPFTEYGFCHSIARRRD